MRDISDSLRGEDIFEQLCGTIARNANDLLKLGQIQQSEISEASKIAGGKGVSQKAVSELVYEDKCRPTLKTLCEFLAGIHNANIEGISVIELLQPNGVRNVLAPSDNHDEGHYLLSALDYLLRREDVTDEQVKNFFDVLTLIEADKVMTIANTLRSIDAQEKPAAELLTLVK